MTPEQWEHISEIFEKAVSLEGQEREAYLRLACTDNTQFRDEVDSLLAAHNQAGSQFLNASEAVLESALETGQRAGVAAGRRIGPYLLAERIGHGGMGDVFAASRADGQYEKRVALKLVRSGYDTSFILERFRNERQILANLDHSNIAKLLDGGTTEDTIPYLVMELVEGVPIDAYCDGHKLSVTERLLLFRQVCAAVQYAHQRLVIHRDIKPSNILVTKEGVPKLLDFGIAKILDTSGSTEATMLRPMTPAYASPEQLRGDPISTSTDVYSLGVVLYQLLTGRSPYRVDICTPARLAEAITNDEPERPSTSVHRSETTRANGDSPEITPEAVSGTREASPVRLQKRLRGDLDFILLKALRKEPTQRYSSVEQFSEDIRRHLEGLPVTARKGTWSYRSSKLLRRHKTIAFAAALVFITLTTALIITVREARIAQRRFNDVRKLANSLMFEVHDSIRTLPGATAARKLVIQRSQEYLDVLAKDSRSDPSLLRELAAAYTRLASVEGNSLDANLGDTSNAVLNYRKAVDLLTTAVSLEPSNPDLIRELAAGYRNLSMALHDAGDKNERKESQKKALEIVEPLAKSHPGDQKVQYELGAEYQAAGSIYAEENDFSRALDFYDKSLSVFQWLATGSPADPKYQQELAFCHKHVAAILASQNQFQPALAHYRAALAIDEAQLYENSGSAQTRYNITFTYSDTGWILAKQGDFASALSYYGKALEIRKALADADPQDTRARRGLAKTYDYEGWVFSLKGDLQKSLDCYKQSLTLRQALSEKDPGSESLRFEVAETQAGIGMVLADRAFRANATASESLKFCRDGKAWMQKALPAFLQRKKQGRLSGNRANVPDTLIADIDKCNIIIQRSGSPPAPPNHY